MRSKQAASLTCYVAPFTHRQYTDLQLRPSDTPAVHAAMLPTFTGANDQQLELQQRQKQLLADKEALAGQQQVQQPDTL